MPLSRKDALEVIGNHLAAVSGGRIHPKDLRLDTTMTEAWMFNAAQQAAEAAHWRFRKDAPNTWDPNLTLDHFLRRYRR